MKNRLEVWLDCDLCPMRGWVRSRTIVARFDFTTRTKANFRDKDGSLWIAKFPAHDDIIDVVARVVAGWKAAAGRAGIGRAEIELSASAFGALPERQRRR